MNLPNFLTLLRVLLTFSVAALLFVDVQGFATSAFVIYVFAGATDWFDGYIARKYNIVTTFGKFMDALSDKIMVVTMFMTLFAINLFDSWTAFALICAIISMAREFYISGVRMIASKKGVVIAAETAGKYKAAAQMVSLGAIICAFALRNDFGQIQTPLYNFAFYLGIVLLGVSTLLSIYSAVSYSAKYSNLLKE